MPLYELLCLAKPALPRAEMVAILKTLGDTIYKHGGFVTDLKSYGEQHLAYDIRRPFERYEQAHISQVDFAGPPSTLEDLKHALHVNEKVLRWVVVKRPRFKTPLHHLVSQALEQPQPPSSSLEGQSQQQP